MYLLIYSLLRMQSVWIQYLELGEWTGIKEHNDFQIRVYKHSLIDLDLVIPGVKGVKSANMIKINHTD